MLKRLIARLKHKHEFVKISFREASYGYVRYSIRTYRCKSCGTIREVDGRFDRYE